MAWQFKTFAEIYTAMKNKLLARFPGAFIARRSVIDTIIRGASMQDAEQYIQMGRVLDAFDLDTAAGADLDRRAEDYDIVREPARVSVGNIRIGDSDFTSKVEGSLSVAVLLGGTILNLQAGEGALFPSTFPFNAILDRPGVGRELVAVTNKSGDQLLLTVGTAGAHAIGVSVILSTVASDRTITIGTEGLVPATGTTAEIPYTSTEEGTLLDGDFQSGDIAISSQPTGDLTVVGAGRISQLRTKPFTTATVTNTLATTGGRDLETDDELRTRIKLFIKSLSRGTAAAIEAAALGVELGSQTIQDAQVVEPVGIGLSTLWLDDGTGALTLGVTLKSEAEALINDSETGESRARTINWPLNLGTLVGKVFKDLDRGTATSVGVGSLTDTAAAFGAYTGFIMVDDNRQFYTISGNTATVLSLVPIGAAPATPSLGNYSIYDTSSPLVIYDVRNFPTTPPTALDDLLVNYSTGEVELNALKHPVGLVAKGGLIIFGGYSYVTGIVQQVARVVEGDPDDFEDFPGVKATGTYVDLRIPAVVNISFTIQIVALIGFLESDLRPLVQDSVLQYVNALKIGENVTLTEIIRRVKSIAGIKDLAIISPPSNVVILDGQLPNTDTPLITVV